jgi:putative transposase
MLTAERSFRHKQMPQLIEAVRRHAHPNTIADTEPVGAAA